MTWQDFRLFLLGLVATVLIGGAGLALYVGLFDRAPPAVEQPAEPQTPSAPPAAQTPPQSGAPTTPPAPTPEATAARAKIEETIAAAPDVARFFDRLRLALPSEYDTALAVIAKRRVGGAEDSPDYYLSEAVKSLRQSRGALAARADGPALSAVFAAQLAVLNALSSRDPRLCVDFLYGGASEAFFRFSSENRGLVGALAVAGLDAIVDGKDKNISRPPPTDQDFATLEAALKQAGLEQAEIDALLDGKTPDPPLPDQRMCAAGRLYLETLAKIPEQSRLRIYSLAVDLMARS